jgi:uncharacterized protein
MMRIEVSGLLKETGQSMPLQDRVDLDTVVFQGEDIGFTGPVDVKGSMINAGEYLELSVQVRGQASLHCGRCAESYGEAFDFDLKLRFARSADLDHDILGFSGEWIDIDPYLATEIVTRLPIRRLCSDECKGLCPVCGLNLNQASCDCIIESNEAAQNPFAVLKGFVDDSDEEV